MSSDQERHFQMLFEDAPISLWEQDFSAIREFFNDLRRQGVTDLDAYLDAHPADMDACMGRLRVIRANRKTLQIFKASSAHELL